MSFESIQGDRKPREKHLRFLKEMHQQGAPLARADVLLLAEHNIIPKEKIQQVLEEDKRTIAYSALDRYVLTVDMYRARGVEAGFEHEGEIHKSDWEAGEPDHFDPAFVAFIMSHYKRFCDLVAYKPFWLYIEEACRWMEEPLPDLGGMDRFARMRHYEKEDNRCKQNSMYALWRYVWYKEPSLDGGEGKYEPTLSMFLIAYLIDDRRSAYLGKGRQIISTTTITAIVTIKMIVRVNFHCKLIACDLETTQEIFEDKLKYAFGRLPKWMRPIVTNDKDNLFRIVFAKNRTKGAGKVLSSKVSIVAPKVSAINGGAPDITLVDEAVFLDIFQDMVKEGEPTLYTKVGETLKLRRQLWAWGTGGRSAKGGGSFEQAHRLLFKRWEEGKRAGGIIPLFFDWTCRPGMTVEFYQEQYAKVMGHVEGRTDEEREREAITFRQHYPGSLDDMYTVGQNTYFTGSFIIRNIEKINLLPHRLRPQFGRFDPVYDLSQKLPPDSYLPYVVKDATWVPYGEEMGRGPCSMFMKPRRNVLWTYYQGTDPIMSDEGLSNHASAIYDAMFKTIPCIVDMREDDPFLCYIQSKLMGLYYRNYGDQFAPELIENNIGKPYINWLTGAEWRASKSLVTNMRLPEQLQGGGDDVGFDSKAMRKHHLVELGGEMTRAHGDNIYIPTFWNQQRYFIKKTTGTKVTVGVDDRRRNKDDVIDAVYLAFANRRAHSSRVPDELEQQGAGALSGSKRQQEWELKFNAATGKIQSMPKVAKRIDPWITQEVR